MNEREKFLFDLQGFLVIKNVLTPEEVCKLNLSVDKNLAKQDEDPNSAVGKSKTLSGTHKRGIFTGMLAWQKPWSQPFREIIVHRKAIPYLNKIHGRGWRLDHEPFILTSDYGSEGLLLHGATNHSFFGAAYYIYTNGKMRCGMVVLQYQLVDVNEGDGGLCVIPGSHKANFPCPQEIRNWEVNPEVVHNVSAKAGDLIVFNEATIHGTLPWKNKERERRSLLVRYSPKHLHYAGGYYDVTFPDWLDELTEAQRSVLEPPYIYNRPLLENNGETVVRPNVEY